MKSRTHSLALAAALLLAHAHAAVPQGKGRGLSTREFDTPPPAERQTGKPAEQDAPCGGTGSGSGGGSGGGSANARLGDVTLKTVLVDGQPLPCAPRQLPSWYLSIINFERLVVSDSQGHTDRLYEEEVALKTVPNVSYDALCADRNCVMVVTPTRETYTLKFQPAGVMRLDLVRGVRNTRPDEAVRYLDLNLPRGAWALLRITPGGAEDLRVDKDGDGLFESSVRPTASAAGSAARDTHGPAVSFSAEPAGSGLVRLTINAEDPSGVSLLLYSLDGLHFIPYAGPFVLDSSRVREVNAFAQDRLGNRSGGRAYRPTEGGVQRER